MGNVSIIFVTLMVSFFPLYVSDRYYYIRHDKLYAFYVLASLLLIFMGGVILTHYNQRDKENKIENKKNKFSFTDYGMIGFLISAVISTLVSDYKFDSLTGALGRNNGLILIFAYFVVYFIISRTYRENKVVPIVMAVVSSFGIYRDFATVLLGPIKPIQWYEFKSIHKVHFNNRQQKYFFSLFNYCNATLYGTVYSFKEILSKDNLRYFCCNNIWWYSLLQQ